MIRKLISKIIKPKSNKIWVYDNTKKSWVLKEI